MLVTHGHFDHIADGVELGRKLAPRVIAIYGIGHWLEN
jgi:L-ascorbate metabolism protein UlaG (beta-lactamase superfamily)